MRLDKNWVWGSNKCWVAVGWLTGQPEDQASQVQSFLQVTSPLCLHYLLKAGFAWRLS